jgi:pimeloyl-ACP methyl ester carboxylesterase
MPLAHLDGVDLAYDLIGSADPVVVLICGCGQPAIGWFAIAPALADAGFRVLTFDNRGVPPSSSPPAPYTVDDMVGDTVALVGSLRIDRFAVAGYSMGGWVAETLAAERPDLVQAAAFLGSLNRPTAWEVAVTTVQRDLALSGVELPPLFEAVETLRYFPNHALQDDELVETWLALLDNAPPWENPGRLGQYEACLRWSTSAAHMRRWPDISVPCLALAFEHDIDSPPALAHAASEQIPGCRYVEVPGASHLGMFEQPDQVVTALVDFFRTA